MPNGRSSSRAVTTVTPVTKWPSTARNWSEPIVEPVAWRMARSLGQDAGAAPEKAARPGTHGPGTMARCNNSGHHPSEVHDRTGGSGQGEHRRSTDLADRGTDRAGDLRRPSS